MPIDPRNPAYPDGWIDPGGWIPVPQSASSDTSQAAPGLQPSSLNPGIPNPFAGALPNRPAPRPDPFAAYWSQVPASALTALAWEPPTFPNSPTPYALPAPAPRDIPLPTAGALGGLANLGKGTTGAPTSWTGILGWLASRPANKSWSLLGSLDDLAWSPPLTGPDGIGGASSGLLAGNYASGLYPSSGGNLSFGTSSDPSRDLVAPLSNSQPTSSAAAPLVQQTRLTSTPLGNPQESDQWPNGQWAPVGPPLPSAQPAAPASTDPTPGSGVVPWAAYGPEGISSDEITRAVSPPQSPATGIFGLSIRTVTPGKLLGEAVPDDGGYFSYRGPDGNLVLTDNSKHMLQQDPQSGKLQVFEKIEGTRPATAGDLAQAGLVIAKDIPFLGPALRLPGAADDFWSGKPGALDRMTGVLSGFPTPGWRPGVIRPDPVATLKRPEPERPEPSSGGGASGGGAEAPSPNGAPPPEWPITPTEEIVKALAAGDGKRLAAISPAFPKYDRKTTYGLLVTNEGDIVPLQSANPSTFYDNYRPAGHVEGKAAIWIREHNSTGGVVYHNNTGGTCGFCNSQIRTLLPENARLWVVPPAGAIAKNSWARARPTDYIGNSATPNPPAQDDLFRSQP